MDLRVINFPDKNFKNYLIKNFDKDGDGEISLTEALEIRKILCYDKVEFSSLAGIEYFTNLEELTFSESKVESLDLSNNKLLHSLKCSSNYHLKELNINGCNLLKYLNCLQCCIEELDLTTNILLKRLHCGNMGTLTSLDVSNNPRLEVVSCYYNPIGQIDLSHNTELREVWVRKCG